MSDLIRREDVLTILSQKNAAWHGYTWVLELPAVDAVEVVRCGECVHWKLSKYNNGTKHYCAVLDGFPESDWYCSHGERREDGDNGKHL